MWYKSGESRVYFQSKRYCLVLVALEGSALWGNTLTTALLHDLNRTIPIGTIEPSKKWWYPYEDDTYFGVKFVVFRRHDNFFEICRNAFNMRKAYAIVVNA